MRILIIGGSRFIGAWLTRRLVQAGHTVTLLNRGESQPPFPLHATRLTGDVDQLDAHAAALHAVEADVIVHMLITGTQRAWDFVHLLADTPARAVFISSADVYRAYDGLLGRDDTPPAHAPLSEDAPLRRRLHPYRSPDPEIPEDAEGWSALWRRSDYDKIPAELIFRGALGGRGTILRLPAVYGPGDVQHRLYGHLKRMDDGRPAILMDAAQARWRWSLGYVENVAEAIALAVEQPAAGGRTYNVADAAPTASQWVRQIAARIGWSGQIVPCPRALLPEAMRPEEDFSHDIVLDTSRIRTELGFAPVCTLEEGLDRSIAWERSSPPEHWPDPLDYDAEDAALAEVSALAR